MQSWICIISTQSIYSQALWCSVKFFCWTDAAWVGGPLWPPHWQKWCLSLFFVFFSLGWTPTPDSDYPVMYFFFFFLTVQSWFGSLVGVLAVSCSLSWGHEVWENVCSNCWANIQSVKNGKLFSAKILIYWINQLLKSDLPTWGQRQKLFLKSTNSWAQQSWFCWNMWAKNKCSSFELRWKTQVITEETTWKRFSLFASASLRITVQVKTNQKLNLSFLILKLH